MDIRASTTSNLPLPLTTREASAASEPTNETSPVKDLTRRINFERMSVGQFFDTLNELQRTNRITPDEAMDLVITFPPPCPPGATHEQIRDMPAGVSYAWLREVAAFARPVGRVEEADRHDRVFDLLRRFEGTAQSIDTLA